MKFPGNTIRVILLFSYLFLFTLFLSENTSTAEQIYHQRDYKVVDELVVNNQNKFRTVILKNEEKGISEMRELIANSKREEAWVYLPHREKWIEIGYHEEAEKQINRHYITKAKFDIQHLNELMSENDMLVLYHFHPAHCLSLEDKIRKREKDGLPMKADEIERERVRLLIKSAYPSRSDLLNMIGNSLEIFERNGTGNIACKICSHYGITEYCLTDAGVAYLKAENSLKQILKIKGISLSANIAVNIAGEILESDPREIRNPLERIKMSPRRKRNSFSRYTVIAPPARIQKAIESINSEYIKVTFTPYH